MTLGDILSGIKNLGTKAAGDIGSLLSSAEKKAATGAKTVGDLFNAASSPVNGPAASTIPGIAANTVAGIPKAAGGVAKDLARGAATFALSAGEAIPTIPLETYSAMTGGKGPQIPTYEPKPIPGLGFLGPVESYQNKAKKAVASGESPVGAILKGGGQAVLDEPTGVALKPLAIAGHALAPILGGFIKGGGKEVEAMISSLVKAGTPEEAKAVLTGAGMADAKATELAPKLAQAGTKKDVTAILEGTKAPAGVDTTLYHTTTPKAAKGIQAEGFKTVPPEDQIGQAFGQGTYFSTTPAEAEAWKQFVTNDGKGKVLTVKGNFNIYDPKVTNPADYWDKLAKKAGVKSNPELGQEIADAFLMGKDSMEPDVYAEAMARATQIIEGLKAKGIDGARFVEPIDAADGITNPQVVIFNTDKVNEALKAGAPRKAPVAKAATNDSKQQAPESVGSMKSVGDLLAQREGGAIPPEVPRGTGPVPGVPAGPERRFITRTKAMAPEAQALLNGTYKPRDTQELIDAADKLIAADPAAATKLAIEGTNDNAVAVASRLIDTYVNDGKAATSEIVKNDAFEKAAEIANATAKTLTEHGRAVQAASILGRLTPEGMVRYAARQIQKHNEQAGMGFLERMAKGASGTRKKIPELTGQQAQEIADAMQKIQDMTNPDDKAKAFQELSKKVKSLIPSSLYEKIIALWKAGLLTGIKTSGLNILSNTSHAVSETVKDVPAALVDRIASLFTGKRTLAMTTKGIGSGTAEGISKGWRFFKTGYDERDALTGIDYHQVNFGSGKIAKALQAYEERVFNTLGSEDQPFYYGAKARSLYSQAIAQAKNEGLKGAALGKRVNELVSKPSDEMLKYAVMDAQVAVFQNKTALGTVARGLQKHLPGGEILLPFGKTPSAVATQMINYTPVGAVAHVISQIKHVKAGGSFDQRLFSQAIGRGLTGTGVLAIGAALAEKGLITGSYPTSEKEQKQWQLEGKQANAIKIGDRWRGIGVLGPLGMVLSMGAALGQGIKQTGSFIGGLGVAAAAGGSALTQQSFLYGINQAINALNDPTRYGATFINNTIGSIIPTIIADIARATDTNERLTSTATQRLVSRIPGLRELLQPQVDTFGTKIPTANFLTVMADPTRPYEPTAKPNDPVVLELRRLSDAGYNVTPAMLGTKQGYKTLTGPENTDLWVNAGTAAKKAIEGITQDSVYQTLDDEQKSKLIAKVVDDAETQARARAVLSATKALRGKALDAKLKEMQQDKLLTKTVYKWYSALGGNGNYPL